MEAVAAPVEVGDDRLHGPVAVAVDDVAPVALGQQPGVVLVAHGPRALPGTDADLGRPVRHRVVRSARSSTAATVVLVETKTLGLGRYAHAVSPTALLVPLLFGIQWMDPNWLLDQFGTAFFWVSLAIIFVECGLFFPFLPGDTLLVAMGLFIAGEKIGRPRWPLVNLAFALVTLTAAAFAGNVVGYEIGRKIGPPLYQHDGRILKPSTSPRPRSSSRNTAARPGDRPLRALRRTYITVVAGARGWTAASS